MDKNKQNVILAIILGFLLGFGSAWIWLSRSLPIEESGEADSEILGGTEEKTEETDSPDVSGVSNVSSISKNDVINSDETNMKLTVSDQTAGDKVIVSKISLSQTAWIVIYEDQNGEPGNILGARIFDKEMTSGEVELLRGTESGKTYYAVIHDDDGDRQFDYYTDLVEREEATGEIIITTFKAL